MTIALHATFTAQPGRAEEIAELLRDYAERVQAEPGNQLFAASQLDSNPDSFFVYEEYTDQSAFDTHLSAPYGAVFNANLSPLIVEPQSVLTLLNRI